MRKLTFIILLAASQAHAASLENLQKVSAIQQATIKRMECELRSLSAAFQKVSISCHPVAAFTSGGYTSASCAEDEQLTGGGGSGEWKTAITDSRPINDRTWSVSRRDVVGGDRGTDSQHSAIAMCCKLIKPLPSVCF